MCGVECLGRVVLNSKPSASNNKVLGLGLRETYLEDQGT